MVVFVVSKRWVRWAIALTLTMVLGASGFATPRRVPDDPVAAAEEGAKPTRPVGALASPAWKIPATLSPDGPHWADLGATSDLAFENPVVLASPPGDHERLFVVERTGRIYVVTNLAAPTKTLFLDLGRKLHSSYLEAGVLGLAFHPNYATNRQFFVFRTTLEPQADGSERLSDVLARFETSPDDPNRAEAGSEVRLFVQEDWNDAHNAGDLKFGPDGYLYVTVGDETPPAGEQDGTRQPLQGGFFGAVLRLDVDLRPGSITPNPHSNPLSAYAIPPDNPLIGMTHYFDRPLDPARVRTEIFAYGFRNPWRMVFEPASGELIVGDVGGAMFEELNRVRPGGNYGWPFVEGETNTVARVFAPADFRSEAPWYAYAHRNATNQGNSIIAGVFYGGSAMPELAGRLIFADCRSGHTWALERGPSPVGANPPAAARWLCTEPGLVTFAADPRDGEVLAANYRTGRIMKLQPAPTTGRSDLPATLAETGIFTDLSTLTPAARVHPYEINAPFWSDNAIKQRWVSLPPDQPPTLTESGAIAFPLGTVWVKHFDLELIAGNPASRRRLETRLLVQSTQGVYGATYRWGDSRTDAQLVPNAGLDEVFEIQEGDTVRTQVWHYPGRAECLNCHNPHSGPALAYSFAQLDRPTAATVAGGNPPSQLDQLRAAGQLPSESDPHAAWAPLRFPLPNPRDVARPLEQRVRAYLASNCSSCHVPGHLQDTGAKWDARLEVPLEKTGLLDGKLVVPGDLWASRFYLLVSRYYDDLIMPPIGSNVRDDAAVSLVENWILSLPLLPWAREDLGAVSGLAGYSTRQTNAATLSSPGGGANAFVGSQMHFLHRPLGEEGFFEARLHRYEPDGTSSAAGLALTRISRDPDSGVNWPSNGWALALDGSRRPGHFALPVDGSFAGGNGATLSGPARLRWTRNGRLALGELIAEGATGGLSTRKLVDAGTEYEVGLFASGSRSNDLTHAWFDEIAWANVRWLEPADGSVFAGRSQVPLTVGIDTDSTLVTGVEFLVGETVLGTVSQPPYQLVWTNPPAGVHALSARIQFANAKPFRTTARRLTVQAAPALVAGLGEDRITEGDWRLYYGTLGYVIPGAGTNLLAGTVFRVRAGQEWVWENPSTLPAALQQPTGAGRLVSGWSAPEATEVEVLTLSDESRRLTLYTYDPSGSASDTGSLALLDANTGALVEERVLSELAGGVYTTWAIRGNIRVRFTPAAGSQAILAGVFLDAHPSGSHQVRLLSPTPDSRLEAPGQVRFAVALLNPGSPPVRVDFYADDQVVASALPPDLAVTWSDAPAGAYEVFARAWNTVGEFHDTAPVHLEVAPAPASARFVGVDSQNQGEWVGRLGAEGYALPPEIRQLPATVSLSVSNAHFWNWQQEGTVFDNRALAAGSTGPLQATCWTSPESIFLDLDLRDGYSHLLSLYLVDWDTDLRREVIEISDPATGQVLSSHFVPDFFSGVYASFLVRGAVRVRLQSEAINAVLSGLFLDREARPTEAEPFFTGAAGTPAGIQLQWQGAPGSVFQLQVAETPTGAWTSLPYIHTSQTADYSYLDPWPTAGGVGARYYRLVLVATP